MHVRSRRALQDVLTAIRHGCTIDQAGWRLYPNAERHLRALQELATCIRRRCSMRAPHRRALQLFTVAAAL